MGRRIRFGIKKFIFLTSIGVIALVYNGCGSPSSSPSSSNSIGQSSLGATDPGAPDSTPGGNSTNNSNSTVVTDFGPNSYLSVDTLKGTTGFAIRGASAGAGLVTHGGYAGSALTFLDFNHDGISDLAIGEPEGEDFFASGLNNSDRGQIHVLYGTTKPAQLSGVSSSGFDLRTLNGILDTNTDGNGDGVSINGSRATAATRSGYSLGSADINCSGQKDLLIGQVSLTTALAYTVFSGSIMANFELDNLTSAIGFSIFGSSINHPVRVESGHIFSGSCDQIVVSEPLLTVQGRTLSGLVSIASGNPSAGANLHGKSFESDNEIFRFFGPANAKVGISTAIGDLDGDGLGEIAIGSVNSYLGRVYVVYGSALLAAKTERGDNIATPNSLPNVFGTGFDLSNLSPVNGFTIHGYIGEYSDPENVGRALTFVDLNSDGLQDLIIGAPADSTPGDVFVLFGKHAGLHDIQLPNLSSTEGIRIYGEVMTDPLNNPGGGYMASTGRTLSPAGDFNHDGLQDLLIGAPMYSNGVGRVYVVYGSNQISNIHLESLGSRGLIITGSTAASTSPGNLGSALAGMGDFNADGISDIALGAPNSEAGSGRILSGKAYLVFGR